MDKIYSQAASRAIDAVKRRDEQKVELSTLDSAQVLAEVGDTVPLAFTRLEDGAGGVWLRGLMVRLGYSKPNLSLLYVLSQGQLGAVAMADIFYGSLPYSTYNGTHCQGYEAIPPCVSVPGGEVAWTQENTYSGPSLPNAGDVTSITSKSTRATGFDVTIEGECYVDYSGQFFVDKVGGAPNGEVTTLRYKYTTTLDAWQKNEHYATIDAISASYPYSRYTSDSSGDFYWWNTDAARRSIKGRIYTLARWDYVVRRVSDKVVVKSGTFWAGHGTTRLSIVGLPPSSYILEFSGKYAERSDNLLRTYTTIWYAGSYNYQTIYLKNLVGIWANQGRISRLDGTTVQNISPEGGSLTERFTLAKVIEPLYIDAGTQPVNSEGGLFQDLTLLGLNADVNVLRPPDGAEYFKQVAVFIQNGIKVPKLLAGDAVDSSNNYADLVRHLLRKALREEQIDQAALLQVAKFTEVNKMRFDGVINTSSNLREWLQETAPFFLCHPRQRNGAFGVVPAVPCDARGSILLMPPAPVELFSDDDLFAYSRTYEKTSQRMPFCAVMVFQEQSISTPSTTLSVELRYAGEATAGPFEQYDMSEFCCTRVHAELAGRYILARRRHITHSISFQCASKGRQLLPGDLIRLTLTATADSYLYSVDSIEEAQEGLVGVTATHFPVDEKGQSLITLDLSGAAIGAK